MKTTAFVVKALMLLLVSLLIRNCSPLYIEDEQAIPYSCYSGTVWYVVGDRNNLDEYVFYRDSIIIWCYTYSPVEQYYGDYVYPQYTVMSIIKRKLEILEHDIQYKDGDGHTLLLQYYRGYTVLENGARPYDWSTYSHIYVSHIDDSTMHFGLYDEFAKVQTPWEFFRKPPIPLNFSNFNMSE